jgi:ABC-2 type transport system ATP-binding protein
MDRHSGPARRRNEAIGGVCVIKASGLTKCYGAFVAVRELNLRVPEQGITGFLGRNGAGKSTTIKMLLGMVHPTAGTGIVLGKHVDDRRQSREIRRQVAYVGEDKQMYAYMTVEQLIRFTRSFYSDWHSDHEQRLLKQYQLPLDRRVKALSKGMRTKLALLLALARRPALLILDEPSEGLDPVSIEELLQELAAVRRAGTALFFSSHQITEVERVADHVCIMDRGRLVLAVSMDQLRQNCQRIKMAFETQPPPLEFHIEGVHHLRTSGREVTLFASHNVDAIVELARDLGAAVLEIAPINLREVFLEKVKDENA